MFTGAYILGILTVGKGPCRLPGLVRYKSKLESKNKDLFALKINSF